MIRGIEESSFIQMWIDKGREEGRAEIRSEALTYAKNVLLKIGRKTLGHPDPDVVEAIERVDDLGRTEALTDRISIVGSWKELLDEPASG